MSTPPLHSSWIMARFTFLPLQGLRKNRAFDQ